MPRPISLGLVVVLFGVGCTTGISSREQGFAERGSAESSPAASLWNGNAPYINVELAGSGSVPEGSQCAPGERSFLLDLQENTLAVVECAGAPLRLQSRADLPLTADVRAQVVKAVTNVTPATAPTCVSGQLISGSIAEVGAAVITFCDDTHACGASHPNQSKPAIGLPAVVALLAPLADAQPLLDAPWFPSNPNVPAIFWSSSSADLEIAVTGAGVTPVGSSCVVGSKTFDVIHHAGGPWEVNEFVCRDANTLADLVGSSITLDDDTASRLQATLTAVTITTSSTCDAAAPYATINVGASSDTVRYSSAGTSCRPTIDLGPFVDVSAVLDVLNGAFSP